MLNIVDYTIITVIILSVLLGFIRGFSREAVSIVTWVTAFIITQRFYPLLATHLHYFSDRFLRDGIAMSLIFITILVIGVLLNKTISFVVQKTGLVSIDYLLGLIFGIFRGLFIITAALFATQKWSQLPQADYWKNSLLIPHFTGLVDMMTNLIKDFDFSNATAFIS